ncbi:unnamed protein product, partial [Prorocentrum cordatum]
AAGARTRQLPTRARTAASDLRGSLPHSPPRTPPPRAPPASGALRHARELRCRERLREPPVPAHEAAGQGAPDAREDRARDRAGQHLRELGAGRARADHREHEVPDLRGRGPHRHAGQAREHLLRDTRGQGGRLHRRPGDQHPVGGQRLRGPRARLRVPAHGDAARQREVRRVGRPRRRLPRRAAKARQEEARREPEVHRLHAHVRRAAAPAEGPPGRPLLHQSLRGREAGAAGGRQRRGHLLREARLAVLPLARARGPRQPAAGARGLLRGAGARGEHQAGRNRGDSGALRTVRHQRGGAQGGAGGRCGAQVAAGVHHERLQKLAGILPLLFHAAPGHDRGDRVQGLRPRQPHRQRPALRGGDKRRGHWRRPVRRAARPRRLVRGRLLRLEARRRAAEHAPAAAVRVLRVRRHGRRGVGDAAG